MQAKIYSPTPANLRRLAGALRRGELVALPTETVYGLAANALDPRACRAIFRAKGRPANDPLIVHVLNLAQGKVTITVSNVSGLASGDTFAFFLSTAHYYITVGTIRYEFVPTTVTTSGSSITIAYTLKNSALPERPWASM